MTTAFHVPEDLALRTDLTVHQCTTILHLRRKIKTLKTRVAGLPAKKEGYEKEIADLTLTEEKLLEVCK